MISSRVWESLFGVFFLGLSMSHCSKITSHRETAGLDVETERASTNSLLGGSDPYIDERFGDVGNAKLLNFGVCLNAPFKSDINSLGQILVPGTKSDSLSPLFCDSAHEPYLAKVAANGKSSSFIRLQRPPTTATMCEAYAVKAMSDKILALIFCYSGRFSGPPENDPRELYVARYSSTGQIDPSFGTKGYTQVAKGSNPDEFVVANDKIFVLSFKTLIDLTLEGQILRKIDLFAIERQLPQVTFGNRLAVGGKGAYYLFVENIDRSTVGLIKLGPDGTWNKAFAPATGSIAYLPNNGYGTIEAGPIAFVGGRIMIGGRTYSRSNPNQQSYLLAAFDFAGNPDPTFDGDGMLESRPAYGPVDSMILGADNNIWVGGWIGTDIMSTAGVLQHSISQSYFSRHLIRRGIYIYGVSPSGVTRMKIAQ